MMFGDVLETKEAVLHNKIRCVLYCATIGYFPKGLIHDFGQKFELSSSFVLLKLDPGIMFGDVLDRKEAVLDLKNMYLL